MFTCELRILDLYDCESDSGAMRDLIKQCPKLEELSVARSTITTDHLLEALVDLQGLEKLSASFIDCSPTRIDISLRGLKKLYVETRPDPEALKFIRSFLDVCPATEVLHIAMTGKPRGGVRTDTLDISPATFSKLEMLALHDDSYGAASYPLEFFLKMDRSLDRLIRHSEKSCWIEFRGDGEPSPALTKRSIPTLWPSTNSRNRWPRKG